MLQPARSGTFRGWILVLPSQAHEDKGETNDWEAAKHEFPPPQCAPASIAGGSPPSSEPRSLAAMFRRWIAALRRNSPGKKA
jgi:hypothetical protein